MRGRAGLRSNRNFLYLLGGRAFSEFGDYFGEFAISWLVYTATGSVFSLGVTWLFFLIPRSAVRLWGGVYVDRYDKRRLMIFTETTRGILFGLLAVAVVYGLASAPLVYVVSFAVGLIGAVFDIASQAVLPLLVEPASLFAANSYFTGTFQLDSVAGPAAAGVAIYTLGVAASLSIDGASFFFLVVALLLIRIPGVARPLERAGSWTREFRQGWAYFKSRTELVWLGLLVGGVNFGLGGFWYVYSLIFARDVLNSGSAGYGALNAFSAAGIFAVSAYLGRKGLAKRRRSVVFSMFAMGTLISLTSFTRTLPEALLAIIAFGASIPLISIVQNTYYQRTVPQALTGRIFGLQQFFDYVTVPAGIVFAIYAAESFGVTTGILISGLVIIAFGLASLMARSLARLDAEPSGTTSPSQ
ncbi:MAG: MFS transporter [Nitrososphaerales archaeon]|nr:MFS transporter [Nitrososphaerales archaeon]